MIDFLRMIGFIGLILAAYMLAGYFDAKDQERIKDGDICVVQLDGYVPPHKLRVLCADLAVLPKSLD